MDESVENSIEIIANVLYLIEHHVDDPKHVLELLEISKSSMEILLRHAAALDT